MKSKAYYTPEQFSAKVIMKDDVWEDMDNEMLDKVTEFEKHISGKLWAMFVQYLNLPNTYLKQEMPYTRTNRNEN